MEQQKIVFVSHCALNTAAKVQSVRQEGEQEEKTAQGILHRVVDQGIQIDSALPGIYPLWRKPLGVMSRNSLTILSFATTAEKFYSRLSSR